MENMHMKAPARQQPSCCEATLLTSVAPSSQILLLINNYNNNTILPQFIYYFYFQLCHYYSCCLTFPSLCLVKYSSYLITAQLIYRSFLFSRVLKGISKLFFECFYLLFCSLSRSSHTAFANQTFSK